MIWTIPVLNLSRISAKDVWAIANTKRQRKIFLFFLDEYETHRRQPLLRRHTIVYLKYIPGEFRAVLAAAIGSVVPPHRAARQTPLSIYSSDAGA